MLARRRQGGRMNAARRAQAILADPAAEWAAIEKEPGDPAYVLSRYVTVWR